MPFAAAVGTSPQSRDDSPGLRTSQHLDQGRVETVRDRSPPRVVSPALTGAHASANISHAAWTDYSSPAACKIDEAPTKTPLADIRSSPFIASSSASAVLSYATNSTWQSPFILVFPLRSPLQSTTRASSPSRRPRQAGEHGQQTMMPARPRPPPTSRRSRRTRGSIGSKKFC